MAVSEDLAAVWAPVAVNRRLRCEFGAVGKLAVRIESVEGVQGEVLAQARLLEVAQVWQPVVGTPLGSFVLAELPYWWCRRPESVVRP